MNEPTYYLDPLARHCEAQIVTIDRDRNVVVCSDTVFYPEGGGQPADRGTIALSEEVALSVIDVQKRDDGAVEHFLSEALPENVSPGYPVHLTIEWNHRYEYMQQHTGQHVISGALMEVAQAPTVSVHQGSTVTTIEVDTPEIDEAVLTRVEARANEVVGANLTVRAYTVSRSECDRLQLRRPTTRTGAIRIVEIDGFDRVACGGVHLPATAMLNVVHLVGVERIRGRLRLAWMIGDRALRDYAAKDRELRAVAQLYSCAPLEVLDRVTANQQELKDSHRTARLRALRIGELLVNTIVTTTDHHVAMIGEEHDVFQAVIETAANRAAAMATNGETIAAETVPRLITNRNDARIDWALIVPEWTQEMVQRVRTEVLAPHHAKGGGKPPLLRGVIQSPSNGDEAVAALADAFERVVKEMRDGSTRFTPQRGEPV